MTIRKVGDTETITYSGNVQAYTITRTGIYKVELNGAAGGYSGGYGGYTQGYRKFKKGEIVYVACGGAGSEAFDYGASGGFNGGGSAHGQKKPETRYRHCGSGGGATHIASVTGTLAQIGSATNVYAVAGGGGGGYSQVTAQGDRSGASGGSANNQNASGSFGQGASYSDKECGGGGGLAGGNMGLPAGAGSGYNGGLTSWKTYEPSIEVGTNTGHGYVVFTLVKATNVCVGDQDTQIYLGDIEIDAIYKGEQDI